MEDGRTTCRQPEHERAFVLLVRNVEDELRGFVRQRVRSGHSAQDIVQKTFLLAWRNSKFDPEHEYARAWLFKPANRLIIDWLESVENHTISLENLSEPARTDTSR